MLTIIPGLSINCLLTSLTTSLAIRPTVAQAQALNRKISMEPNNLPTKTSGMAISTWKPIWNHKIKTKCNSTWNRRKLKVRLQFCLLFQKVPASSTAPVYIIYSSLYYIQRARKKKKKSKHRRDTHNVVHVIATNEFWQSPQVEVKL